MKLDYFDTLYQRDATMLIVGPLDFWPTGFEFGHMGHGTRISYEEAQILTPEPDSLLKVTYYSLNYSCPIRVFAEGSIEFRKDAIFFTTEGRSGVLDYIKLMTLEEVPKDAI